VGFLGERKPPKASAAAPARIRTIATILRGFIGFLEVGGTIPMYLLPYTVIPISRGRPGFDGGSEAERACRGVEHLVNPTANHLVANDDNYALAA
jgi:hypothetical protein